MFIHLYLVCLSEWHNDKTSQKTEKISSSLLNNEQYIALEMKNLKEKNERSTFLVLLSSFKLSRPASFSNHT